MTRGEGLGPPTGQGGEGREQKGEARVMGHIL